MIKFNTLICAALCAALPFVSSAQQDESTETQRVTRHLIVESTGLTSADLAGILTTDRYKTAHNGMVHRYFSQSHAGLPIVNSSASAVFDASGRLVKVFDRFLPVSKFTAEAAEPSIDAVNAVRGQLLRDGLGNIETQAYAANNGIRIEFSAPGFFHQTTAELAYFADPEGRLRLFWEFDLDLPDHSHWYRYYISAHSGTLVQRYDWLISCSPGHAMDDAVSHGAPALSPEAAELTPFDGSSYRVFDLPTESPNHGERHVLTEPADPLASPYGWHDDDGQEGAEFTITRGNNVNAYEDSDNSGMPGFSPDGGADLEFDFPYDPTELPETYTAAAVTNLFYVTNRYHDILYHYGFDEAAGNFQTMNYSGDGAGHDALLAESQDGGGVNNANMATPEEGGAPRMQMYLWEVTSEDNDGLTVHDPSGLAGTYTTSAPGAFGPPVPEEGITADLILAEDNLGDLYDLCTTADNATEISGQIALLRRGDCSFVEKVENAQAAGAVAVIVVNNAPGALLTMGGSSSDIDIPSVMVSQADGEAFISALAGGENMEVTLAGIGGASLKDGSFDNGIVAHEYVHGLSTRLTGGPSSAICLYNEEQAGEGWSDWYATMLTINMDAPNPVYRPMGTFASGQATDGVGIRPVAYDTSFAVNDFTYADLPSSELSVPHGIGFVWATMLWDLSWAFMDTYGYDPDVINGSGGNNMVMQLVTDGLKLQVCQPGFVDARDAILLADELDNGGANKCLIWKVFAKRGLGYSADQGSSNSVYDGSAAFDLPVECQNPTTPPEADFTALSTSTCNGSVQFEDQSTGIPQTWSWTFGDGESSTDQNPMHQYAEEGIYTVALTVTNTLGGSSISQTDFIAYDAPNLPETQDTTVCAGNMATLVAHAPGEGQIRWRNAAMEVVGTGDTLEVQAGDIDETYYAEQVIGDLTPAFVGPQNGGIGSGAYHGNSFVGTVDFVAHQPLTIVSAWVNSDFEGPRIVNLWDNTGGTGTILQSVEVDIDFTDTGRVDLGFVIDAPGIYSIGLSEAGLYRNDAGVNYPYELDDWMIITGSSAGADYYYYFYDLEIEKAVCAGEAVPAEITVDGNAQFTYVESDLTLTFSPVPGSGATSSWDFGDGNGSTENQPIHTFSAPGTYTVTHTVQGGCSSQQDIAVGTDGLTEAESAGFSIYPNPTTDRLYVDIPSDYLGSRVEITMYSADGSEVYRRSLTAEKRNHLKISDISVGVYTAVLRSEKFAVSQRIAIVK